MTAKLNILVTFRRAERVNTGLGVTAAWSDLGQAWASRSDLIAAETVASGTVLAERAVRYLVRKNSMTASLTPKDALVDRETTYQITGVRDHARPDMLEITAEARADR